MELFQREFSEIKIQVPWGFISGHWYGSPDFKPILALHGWLDNFGTFEKLIQYLPNHVSVLCIDLPGHGLSSKMPIGSIYHHLTYVIVILIVMKKYKWNKVSLLGHSMGGLVSFLFALLYPDRIDMIISIDIIKPGYYEPKIEIAIIYNNIEKALLENQRLKEKTEPPIYSYDQMVELLHTATDRSIELENCKFILDRNITRSQKYPEKYFFSRDARVKNLFEFNFTSENAADMAKRIPLIPYLVIKGRDSTYIDESSNKVISVLEKNNPNFEFHELDGRHHLHLNNPKEVSKIVNQFINKHFLSKLMKHEKQRKIPPHLSKL